MKTRCERLIEKFELCEAVVNEGEYDSKEFDKNQKMVDKLNSQARKLLDAGDDKSFKKAQEIMKEVKVLMNKMFTVTKVGESFDEAVDIKEIIKSVIDTNWSKDNESQMKVTQLLKGIATSDDPASNAFMKAMDDFTSSLKVEDFVK